MNNKLLLSVGLVAAMFAIAKYTDTETRWVAASDIRVIDGGTVDVNDIRYRLLGFDTPETRNARCDEERALGETATTRLKQLFRNARGVELEIKPGRDKYRRKLAEARVFGRNVSEALIAEGLARPYNGGKRLSWCELQSAASARSVLGAGRAQAEKVFTCIQRDGDRGRR